MTRNSSTVTISTALALLALSAMLPSPAAAGAGSNDNTLTGAWTVQVQLRDCTSGAALGSPITSLVSFHDDGTLSESVGALTFAPGQRSSGHGAWTRRGRTYRQEMIALILFDTPANLPGTPAFDPTKPVSPGFFAGWQTVTHTVRMAGPDRIESSGTNAFYRANGELYRSGCSTATGQRF